MTENRSKVPTELAREIVRQGEARLEAIAGLSTAAVARATTLCGIFGAASVALGAAVLAYLGSGNHAAGLVWGGGATAGMLFVASVLAAVSGAARDFYIKGGRPAELFGWAWDSEGERWWSQGTLLKAIGDRLTKATTTHGGVGPTSDRRPPCWSAVRTAPRCVYCLRQAFGADSPPGG